MREEDGLEAAAVEVPAAAAAAAARQVCWNTKCGSSGSSKWRPGWVLRAGNTAYLCDSCGLAYEQFRFCETFHSDDAGWRTCNSCKKRVHCGCIASVYGLVLLDKGGVECSGCAQQDDVVASSSMVGKHGQQLLAKEAHTRGKGEDPTDRRQCEGLALAACQSEPGPWQPPSSAACAAPLTNAAVHPAPWDSSLKGEQLNGSQAFGTKSQEQEVAISDLEPHVHNLDSSKVGSRAHSPNAAREGTDGRGMESPGHVESSSPSPKSGTEMPSTGLIVSGRSSPAKEVSGEASQQQQGGLETGPAGELGDGKTTGFYRPPRVQQLLPRPAISGPSAEPGFDPQAPLRVARPPGEGRGRNQLLPRYWPRITDQELQQITSGEYPLLFTGGSMSHALGGHREAS